LIRFILHSVVVLAEAFPEVVAVEAAEEVEAPVNKKRCL
jgi:hypothetical protein